MPGVWKASFSLLFLVACGGCATTGDALKLYKYVATGPAMLRHGTFEVEVERMQSAAGATNYVARVTVANAGPETRLFDVDDFELVDETTGMTYPRLVPSGALAGSFGMLEDTELKPGRKVQGSVYFKTAAGEARSKQLTLHLGEQRVDFRNDGFLTQDDLEKNDSFRD